MRKIPPQAGFKPTNHNFTVFTWAYPLSSYPYIGRVFPDSLLGQHSFVEIDHEIFSTVILSLPLIQEGQLSVSGERMCTILVNRLEDYACPVNVWLSKLTALDMTPLGWLGCKTSTQTNKRLAFGSFPKSCSGLPELRDKSPDWCIYHQCKLDFIYFWLWILI